MQLPFLLSALIHIIILLGVFFGLDVSYTEPIIDENPMLVEFAKLGHKTAAPVKSDLPEVNKKQKAAPTKEKKEPVEQKEKTSISDKERHSNHSDSKDRKPIKKTQDVNLSKSKTIKKKPDNKNKNDKKQKTPPNHRAQMNIDAKNNKDQKGKKSNLDDMLDDLLDNQAKDEKTSTASANETDESFTMSEISALRAHISRCWNVHSGAKGAQNHVVDVEIHLSKDGFVQSTQVVNKARMKHDNYYRVAAETAQRSLLDDDCNPLPIPASAYDKWKVITFRFDPKDMF